MVEPIGEKIICTRTGIAKLINLHQKILLFEKNMVCHEEKDAKQTVIQIRIQ